MLSCRHDYAWDLSVPQKTNCAHDGVVMPVCANSSACPGVCLVPKGGSSAFKLGMRDELARKGTPMLTEAGCVYTHCKQFPWPAWKTPQRVIRIVRHPLPRLLSAYLDGKHTRRFSGPAFPPNASFADVVRRITSLPDLSLNPHTRLQSAMCAVPPSVPQTILKLEEYSTWRAWLLKELNWTRDALPATPAPAKAPQRISEFYTPELKKLVLAWAAPDLKQFGYAT